MQKEKQKFRLIEARVCPTCSSSFDIDSSHTHCPDDKTLLCPVNADGYKDLVIDQWRVLNLIGEGASGRVHRARHVLTNMSAAIKFLKLSFVSDTAAVKRFQQEALAIKELTDGSITTLYDFGVLDDGTPYLVMELVEGNTLQDILSTQGSLDEDSVRTIFIQVAEAMQAAHDKGIFHRDLKPGNLIVDENLNVKVVDFGLAKFCDSQTAASITRTGVHLGTPAYMSPEQCTGDEIDGRSDIYSLGCVLYECLAGKPLFDSQKAVSLFHKHAFEEPVQLSKHLPKNPQYTSKSFRQLERLVMACLQKDPADRLQSMRQLEQGLKGKEFAVRRRASKTALKKAAIALLCACAIGVSALYLNNLFSSSAMPPGFTPPHAVISEEKQREFAVQNGLIFWITMEENSITGLKDGSQILMQPNGDEKTLRAAMSSSSAKTCFAAWRDWYANIFAYLKASDGTKAPPDVRMKMIVTMDKNGKVSSYVEWHDPVTNPASQAYIDRFVKAVSNLESTPLKTFPSSSTESVEFEIYLEPDQTLKVFSFDQTLR